MIFYNDREGLKRTLASLEQFKYVFCIDGKFRDVKEGPLLSNDGSREVIDRFSNAILCSSLERSEPEKRSVYLEMASSFKCDYLLVIDTDEYVIGNIDERELKEPYYYVRMVLSNHKLPVHYSPRFIKIEKGMKYGLNHNRLLVGGKIIELAIRANKPLSKVLEGFEIHGDDALRTEDYRNTISEYQKILFAQEQGLSVKANS